MSEVIINKTRYECPPAVAAYIKELKTENARFKELYQKLVGVIAATDCVECKDKAVEHGRWIHITRNEYKCSLCEARIWVKVVPLKGYTSCWHCGVKMDLKDGESE